jgi:exosome complex RNA-binding protein Csl4
VGVNTLLLSSDLSNENPKYAPSALSSLTKGVSDHQSPFWIFVLVGATTSFPQTAPIVDAIFCPVMWHHQRRPFVRVLACKTRKTRRGLADEASSDGQVSQVSKERRRRRKSVCLK